MKLHILFLSTILFLFTGCASDTQRHLPKLTAATETVEISCCTAVFPRGKWQFVHSIDFTMGNGAGTGLIGVTSFNEDHIDCALITVEGFTLFEAAWSEKDGFKIRRAIAPFDNPRFAEGLMRDLRAIFTPPAGRNVETGQLPEKHGVCRYSDNEGRIVDVLPNMNNCWQINIYDSHMTLDRSITGRSCRAAGSAQIPDFIELKSFGQNSYTLKMTLIRADNNS